MSPYKHRTDLTLVAAAFVAALVSVLLYGAAYPTVTFEDALLRRDVVPRARAWLATAGYNTRGLDTATTFRTDVWSRRYFEERFNPGGTAVWGTGICAHVWQWYVRFYRPGQEREFRVFLSPGGDLVELYCAVPELEPAPPLDRARARQVADRFAARCVGDKLQHYRLDRRYLSTLPRREDYSLVWVRELRTFGHAKVELRITVTGDRVSHFQQGLRVPKSFKRHYAQSRSKSDMAGQAVGYAVYVIAAAAALVWLAVGPSRGQARFAALAVAAGAIVLGLALQRLNSHHVIALQYPTTASYPLHVLRSLVAGLRWDLFLALTAVLAGACGLGVWPRRALGPPELLAGSGSRLRGAAIAGLRGSLVAACMMGLSVLFTIASREWLYARLPVRPGTTDLFCDAVPAYSVAVRLAAEAFRDELVFRVFATAALFRLLRSRGVAVVLASILWGASGLNRDAFPASLSLIEGAVHGLLLSWAFLRFDVLTAMAASYLFAAMPMALPLLHAHDAYLVLNGAAALALPLLPAVCLLLPGVRGRGRARRSTPALTYGPLTRGHLAVLCRGAERAVELEERSIKLLGSENALALACFEASTPVAFSIAAHDGHGRAELQAHFVSRPWRRRHIGSQLMHELLGRLLGMGVIDLVVQADHRDQATVAFLSAHGFRQTSGVFARRLY